MAGGDVVVLRGNLVLGLFVATWHLPYWVLQGVFDDHGAVYLLLDFVFVVALTYQLAWLVRRSRGSVLVAVVFHVSFNVVNVALLPVTATTAAFAILAALEVAVALVAVRSLSSASAGGADTSRQLPDAFDRYDG